MSALAILHEQQFYRSYIGDTTLVAVDGSVHLSAILPQGRYALLCRESAVYLRQGGPSLTVTGSDARLAAEDFLILNVDDSLSQRLAVMTAAGLGGQLRATRIDALTGVTPAGLTIQKPRYFGRFIGATTLVAVGAASVASVALAPGRYVVHCPEVGVYLRQGAAGVTATTNDLYLPTTARIDDEPGFPINVDGDSSAVVAVLSGAPPTTGTLRITRRDSL